MAVDDGGLQRAADATHQRVERRRQRPREAGEDQSARHGQDQRVHDETAGIVEPPRAQGTRHRCGDAAAHAAHGDVHHQHLEGEDQRDGGERIDAQPADEIDVDGRDEDLHQHETSGRPRQPQQAPPDGRGQKRMGQGELRSTTPARPMPCVLPSCDRRLKPVRRRTV
jgi:hypothetical protein